jgi:hypothetical protein
MVQQLRSLPCKGPRFDSQHTHTHTHTHINIQLCFITKLKITLLNGIYIFFSGKSLSSAGHGGAGL